MKKIVLACIAAGVALPLSLGAAQAKVFEFSFDSNGGYVSGSGFIITGNTGSPYTVTSMTGSVMDTDPLLTGTFSIISHSMNGYAGGDNLLYYRSVSYVDFGGVSFATSGGVSFNLGGGGSWTPQYDVLNVSSLDPGGYPLITGSYNVNLTVTAVPELSTWGMMLAGFASLGFAGYRGSRKVAVAA